ncbi:PRD domain-containing protein [Virgibacillus sp. NKC19-3]|uniref:PRD domain-containing protein n=1 Tax=Virgibacillus saliphilus TaxID=2831674 RepID=UPI001C9B2081|nr:PRD domain-containing protein [Virgibacillus sp. NKC19-3]MBY7144403.1 PRD domain-containing protein [Virgibacillus sp. NKC19-3]
MKIKKILNNNAVVVIEQEKEKIAVGAGVAFEKKKNDIVNIHKVEKTFIIEENERLQQLLSRIPEEHFTITEEIITYAEESMEKKLNEHIHVVLTDHISFAIERQKKGMEVKNKLLNEIKILYKKEFEIGLWAIKHIKEQTQIDMPVDEAAFIALHIHTFKANEISFQQTLRQTTIVRDMVQTIIGDLKINVEEDSVSYQRLIMHLHFLLDRTNHYEIAAMDAEMLDMLQNKFPVSYRCARNVSKKLLEYDIELPYEELGYIILHIERLRNP